MCLTDPISDFLTCIRNANINKKKIVEVNYSKIKNKIAEVLKNKKFIYKFEIYINKKKKKILKIFLYYIKGNSVINKIKRISKPGLRVYIKANEINKILNGFKIIVLSTTFGLLTNNEIKEKNVGGEVLFYIW